MGNEESKSWLFQNVLFLDPNAPPFISQEEYERRQRARETGEDVYGAVNGNRGAHGENDKRGVKRFTPGQTKLRTRAFRVLVDVGGRSSEFQLKCSNDPMAFILMDRQSRPLRTIPTGFVRKMQRKGNGVTCRFGTSPQQDPDEEQIQMTFDFFDSNDCTTFVDSVKLLFGIYVEEYGVTREEKGETRKRQIKGGTSKEESSNGLPKRSLSDLQIITEEDQAAAKPSSEYPVTINGKLETGTTLKWADISVLGRSYPPKGIEWRVSYVPGREPEFGLDNAAGGPSTEPNVIVDETLLVTDSMVGKFIQVKVIRRVKEASQRLPVVYSLAMKGPVSFDDRGAREVLEIITKPSHSVNIEMSPEDVLVLFADCQERIEQQNARQPYLEAVLTITRQGIMIEVPSISATAPFEITWNCFYLTRLDASQSDWGNEEDLYLQLHLKRSKKKQVVLRLATSSERVRNSAYHAIYFLKLQKSFKGFDRWVQDLERGNYSVFKQRYSKLWAGTAFYEEIVDATEIHPIFTAGQYSKKSAIYSEDTFIENQDINQERRTFRGSESTVATRSTKPLRHDSDMPIHDEYDDDYMERESGM